MAAFALLKNSLKIPSLTDRWLPVTGVEEWAKQVRGVKGTNFQLENKSQGCDIWHGKYS